MTVPLQSPTSSLLNLIAAARTTPNRGRTHIFLGNPHSDACDKTTVEPGNACSPGVWTCGVVLWLNVGDGWTCAEHREEAAVKWTFIEEPGGAPVVVSRWQHAGVSIEHRLCHVGGEGAEGLDAAEVSFTCATACQIAVGVAITDRGPAGGKLTQLTWDGAANTFTADGARIVLESAAVAEVVSANDTHDALTGAAHDAPAGAATVSLHLQPEVPGVLRYRLHHRFAGRLWDDVVPRSGRHDTRDVVATFAAAAHAWQTQLPARIFAPDPRVALAWERCSWHILSAMECGLPRIGAVNYPIFWLRDGIIILRALDLIGRHDLARIGTDWLAPIEYSGGFGAEGDAPGEGVYALVMHARMTRDRAWLAEQWPFIRRRVRTYERMIATAVPIRAICDTRLAWLLNSPGGSVLCLAARDGLAHSRMDHHSPDFFINCWGQAALRLGSEAAAAAGEGAESFRLTALAQEIDARIASKLLPAFGGNDRDSIIAPWPSGALAGNSDELAQRFGTHYRSHRLDADGGRKPEPMWTYFEAAQAHNALLLGFADEGWITLSGMIAKPNHSWDCGHDGEGAPNSNEYLPFLNHLPGPKGAEARGWLHPEHATYGNMPHNWTSGEIIAALRDTLVQERDGRLLLGAGVPRTWRFPGARFGAERLPTDLGPVSFTIVIEADGRPRLEYYDGPADPLLSLPPLTLPPVALPPATLQN